MRPCAQPGCRNLVLRGRCNAHKQMLYREDREARGDSTQRLYGYRWAKARTLWLLHNPVCVCGGKAPGCNGEARVVDHDPPHRGDHDAFWNVATWRGMSKVCHDRKTVLQDGGFGRPRLDKETT
jgi:5-methylcytosine-specific restriction protein A